MHHAIRKRSPAGRWTGICAADCASRDSEGLSRESLDWAPRVGSGDTRGIDIRQWRR
jgi:hypothetical protein